MSRRLLELVVPLLVAACGGGGDGGGTTPPTPTPTISVAASPGTLTLTQGQSGTSTVTLTRGGGYTGTVTLAVTGAPNGVTPQLSTTTLSGGTLTSTLTVAAAANATTGPATLTVTASGSGVTSQTTTVAVTVNATTPQTATLTVAKAGTGAGTVTSSPAGIDCGTTCAAPFTIGGTVTLTAAPTAGSTFAGFSGGCTGTTTTCTVTMSAAQTVTATFNTAAPAASFTLALAPAAVSVQAGGSGTSAVTLTRTNFTGAVALTTSGAPQGLQVTADPASVTGTTATLNVTAAATVAPGTYNVTVSGAGTGVTTQTATLAVTVTAPPATGGFTLAVAPTSVSVQQGGSGTATVNVTRTAPFAGAVALATSGVPNGLTVTPNPASATAGTSTLNIAATTGTAVGTYTITVTGTAAGVATQTATLTVQVTAPPTGGGNVTFDFASCDPTSIPIWLAVQNGTGPWTRVTGANNQFSFTVGAVGGVAYVTQSGTTFTLNVFYGTGTELGLSGNRCGIALSARGTKRLTGSVAGVGLTDVATVSVGGAFAQVVPFLGSAFTLDSVPAGARDLIATRSALAGTSLALSKVIIRRATNYASTIPALDFNSTEAFDPTQATATIGNLNGEQGFASVAFVTNTGASAAFYAGATTGSTIPLYGVPAARLQAGDFHLVNVGATPSSTNPTSTRLVQTYVRTVTDRTFTLGPALTTPTVSTIATTPYPRLRATFASQSQYNGMAFVVYTQTTRSVNITATAGYFGGLPANWTLDIPDLSAAGFDPTWALRSGAQTSYSVSGLGGDFLALAGSTPTDGATIQIAMRSGTTPAFIQALRARGIRLVQRP